MAERQKKPFCSQKVVLCRRHWSLLWNENWEAINRKSSNLDFIDKGCSVILGLNSDIAHISNWVSKLSILKL